MDKKYVWRGPGATKPFDCTLENWEDSKLTKRYIYVLKFLLENKGSEKLKFNNVFEMGERIFKYLEENNIDRPDKPTDAHFYTPFQFVGFINKTESEGGFELNITKVGEDFLKEIDEKNFENALNIYLDQLFNTKFPNDATSEIVLELYPTKIMFKILYDKKIIPLFMFRTHIQFIRKHSDLEKNLRYLDDNCFLQYIEILNYKSKFNKKAFESCYEIAAEKWISYVINGLIFLEILYKNNNLNGFTDKGLNYVKNKKIDEITYESCFINDE